MDHHPNSASDGRSPATLSTAQRRLSWTSRSAASPSFASQLVKKAEAPEGSVLVVAAGERTDCGHFGALAAMDAELRGIQGPVIAGAIRDGGALAMLGFPVFHGGFSPAGSMTERVLS